MRPLEVLAVDDEAPALEDLTYLLRGDRRIGRVLAAGSSDEALRMLERGRVDAVFLDIRMPGLDGLDLVRVLNRFAQPPHVVFVTAHEDFAVDAFALKACDYLLKPVGRERLAEAVRRVAALIESGGSGTGEGGAGSAGGTGPGGAGPGGMAAGGPGPHTGRSPAAAGPGGTSPAGTGPGGAGFGGGGHGGAGPGGADPGWAALGGPGAGGFADPGTPSDAGRPDHREERIPVDLGGVTRFVSRDDVAYAEAWGDYVRLHTASQAPLVRVPLALLEDRWAPYGFLRIHRGYLVSLRHVEELRADAGRWTVRVAGAELPVSRRHSRELRDRLVRWTPGPDGGPS